MWIGPFWFHITDKYFRDGFVTLTTADKDVRASQTDYSDIQSKIQAVTITRIHEANNETAHTTLNRSLEGDLDSFITRFRVILMFPKQKIATGCFCYVLLERNFTIGLGSKQMRTALVPRWSRESFDPALASVSRSIVRACHVMGCLRLARRGTKARLHASMRPQPG